MTEILSLPPLELDSAHGLPTSAVTGEPKRPVTLMVSVVAGWVSVAVTIVAFAQWWWQAAHVEATFPTSARLIEWFDPFPVSALAIVLVCAVAVIGVLMVCAAGMTAYNAWAGNRWIRVGSLICLGVTGLSFLLTWWFTAAMVPLAISILFLWLPPAKKFFAAMDHLRSRSPVVVPTTNIRYGPQPLIGDIS